MDRLNWMTENRMCEVMYTFYNREENMYCIIMEAECF